MTGDDLAAWQRRCGIRTQKEAAHAVRLSLSAYRDKLKGVRPVDERTELLMSYHEVFLDLFVGHCLRQAEASSIFCTGWDPLGRVFDAFGFDCCMWGTDWTRAVNLLSYEQGVEAFRVTDRLIDSERTALMGETLTKIYNWSPAKA